MATKTFKHAVIYNGQFYPANTPVQVKDKPEKSGGKDDAKSGGKS